MILSTRLPQIAALILLATMTAVVPTQGEGTATEPIASPNAVIYGQDDRLDYDDQAVRMGQARAADATSLVVFGLNEQLARHVGQQTTFDMPARPQFCSPQSMAQLRKKGQIPAQYPDERFFNDKVLVSRGSCTAFKVGPDLVATAGHCAGSGASTACGNLSFIFNFRKTRDRPSPDVGISGRDVYQCRQIVARQQTGQLDWAIVKVDRVINAPQVSIRTSAMPAPTVGQGLTLIGYPAGLPLKIASGGKFLSFQENTFRSDVDAYGGNSGAPIFNTQSLERGELLVEGILQGGSDDYVNWCNNPSSSSITPVGQNPCSCAISYRCSFSAEAGRACRGEIGVYARHMERTLGVGGGGTGAGAGNGGGGGGGGGGSGGVFRPGNTSSPSPKAPGTFSPDRK